MALNRAFLLLALLLVASATALPYFERRDEPDLAPLVSSPSAEVLEEQYIVVFKDDLPDHRIVYHHECVHDFVAEEKRSLEKRGLLQKLVSGIRYTYNFKNLKGYAGRFSDDVLLKIRQSDEVAYVERDQTVFATEIQSNAPWGLARISHRGALTFGTFNKYLFDPKSGDGVTVFIVDTGVNTNHTDFGGRATWGSTIPDGDEDIDGNGHGTHVAGTVGGTRYGVSKNSRIVAVKVLRSNGSGTMSDVIKGVEYAAERHEDAQDEARRNGRPYKGSAANMSLGGGKSYTLDRAVNGAVSVGLHFAVAAGNDNRDACDYSPAGAELAVTVGASTIEDERAYFSNYGQCVDVFAPGKDITSAWIGGTTRTNTISGTSMASPHVAGLMAYFLSLQPDSNSEFFTAPLTPKQLRDQIVNLSTKNALDRVPSDTPNRLVFNNFQS